MIGMRGTTGIHKLVFAVELCLCVFCVVCLLSFVRVLPYYWNFPYQLDYTEGATVNSILRVASGKPLYPALTQPPYVVTYFFPLYYHAVSFLQSFLNPANPFFAGRILSVVCLAGTLFMIFLMLLRETREFSVSALFSFYALFFVTFRADMFLSQVNVPAVFLSAAGFAWFYALYPSRRAFSSLVFFYLALFTKQTMFVPFLSCLLFCFVRRKNGGDAVFPVFLIFPFFVLLSALLAHVLSGGNFFAHVVSAHGQPLRPAVFRFFAEAFLKENAFIAFIAALYLFYGKNALFKIYFLASIVFLPMAAKEGAGFIYFADVSLAACLCAGCLCASIKPARPFLYAGMIVFLFLPPQRFARYGDSFAQKAVFLYTAVKPQKERLLQEIRGQNVRVLTEDADMSFLVKKEWYFDAWGMPTLHKNGRWNADAFLKSIESKALSLALYGRRFQEYAPLRKAIEENYNAFALPKAPGSEAVFLAVPKKQPL